MIGNLIETEESHLCAFCIVIVTFLCTLVIDHLAPVGIDPSLFS